MATDCDRPDDETIEERMECLCLLDGIAKDFRREGECVLSDVHAPVIQRLRELVE